MQDFRVKGAGMLDLDPLYRFYVYIMTNIQNNSRLAMPRCVSLSVSSLELRGQSVKKHYFSLISTLFLKYLDFIQSQIGST